MLSVSVYHLHQHLMHREPDGNRNLFGRIYGDKIVMPLLGACRKSESKTTGSIGLHSCCHLTAGNVGIMMLH